MLHHQGKPIISRVNVSELVAEEIALSRFGSVNIGEVVKIKSALFQIFFGHSGLAFGIQCFKDFSVFPEYGVHLAHEGRFGAVFSVVKITAAMVRAVLRICPAVESIAAFYAGFFHLSAGVWR